MLMHVILWKIPVLASDISFFGHRNEFLDIKVNINKIVDLIKIALVIIVHSVSMHSDLLSVSLWCEPPLMHTHQAQGRCA